MVPIHYLLTVLSLAGGAAALLAMCHALIYKRDPRAAAAWVAVILLVPWLGPILYLLFGINRIERKAAAVKAGLARHQAPASVAPLSRDTFLGLVQLGCPKFEAQL